MPRLRSYSPFKTNDYNFLDRNIGEQFNIGGVGVIVHKYVGPAAQVDKGDKSQPNYIDGREVDPLSGEFINLEGIINETKIQDLLFLENRDRKYDPDVYELRGVYNVSDNDFDLTQFGLFLSNDQFYITFHINTMAEILGRKLLAGDVLELPTLREEFPLDANKQPISKFYVVNDASKGAEGFSQTWYPHIWRVKLSPINDSQEYYDILGSAQDTGSLKNNISTYKEEFKISDAIVGAASDLDPDGTMNLDHLFGYSYATSGGTVNDNSSYDHGETVDSGPTFPTTPSEGQYFIRTDFNPDRMFVRRGNKWARVTEYGATKTWSDRTYNASTYINNEENVTIVNDQESSEKQALSEVILPKADV